ncbi:MAG: chemotaxis protein CheW [Candidatus Scalindua sp.]
METVSTKCGGKFLTFDLGKEVYGIDILKVREIIGFKDITAVSQTLDCMKGIITLRRKVIPVIDLRLKFSMPEKEYTQKASVIVIEVGNAMIGIIVDNVSEVLYIKSGAIENAPHFEQEIDMNLIMGLGKIKGKIIILLDIEKFLSCEELEMVKKIVGN